MAWKYDPMEWKYDPMESKYDLVEHEIKQCKLRQFTHFKIICTL